jgi:hypothetical protein
MGKKKLWSTIIDSNVHLKFKIIQKSVESDLLVLTHRDNIITKNKEKESIKNDKDVINKINNIIDIKNIESLNSLEILKNQEIVTNYLSRYFIQNTKLNFEKITQYINWLIKISKLLTTRIKQKIIIHSKNKKNKNNISRSSYKFCTFTSQCEYNYGTKKKPCNADHYVHSYIYADLVSLNQYIKTKTIKDGFIESNREVTKCINTIAYVVRHMYDELRNVCLYQSKENYESVHINKKNNKS